jgi:hypothetical protein
MDNLKLVDFKGLKCDNKSCDFIDKTINFEDFPNFINKPCPKCGKPLLTISDYDTCLRLNNEVKKYLSKISENEKYKITSTSKEDSEQVIMDFKTAKNLLKTLYIINSI